VDKSRFSKFKLDASSAESRQIGEHALDLRFRLES